MVHIAFLWRFWPINGGGETLMRVLANAFIEHGYGITIVYLWDKRTTDMPFINPRIKEYKIKNISDPLGFDGIKKSDYTHIRRGLSAFIKNNSVDIMVNQWLPVKIVHGVIKNTEIKLICPHHTAIFIEPIITLTVQKIFYAIFGQKGKNFNLWRRLYPLYKYADKFVVLAQGYLEDCKKLFKTDNLDKKICVINNPLPCDEYLNAVELKNKKNELLFVGRIVEQVKRISYMIDAWKLLQRDGKPEGWTFKIVGDGPDIENMKRYAQENHCTNIFFEGWQNPAAYYRRASIVLLTSLFEGFPMVLPEAQQNGCVPVVMDSFHALHEIVQHESNGLIVPNNDIPAFAVAIEKLMADNEFRMKLAYKGLETCKRFSIEVIAGQWEDLFKELKRT